MSHTPNTKHGGPRQRPDVIDEIHDEYLSTYPSFISCKQQAAAKPQASSFKQRARKSQAPWTTKPQALSHKHSLKPQAPGSRILEKVSGTSDRGAWLR